jgi:RNA polymerase sigma-70 factor (ECF subfamily)
MSPTPAKESLEKTLQRAAGGDEAAWQRIVEAYGPRVFGLIRAQCDNAELAEEITQSTFCTIVARIGQYTELGRFESWLFRIAMNRLRDEMRRRKRHARPVETEALVGLAGADDRGAPETLGQDEVQALRTALDRLSEADRRVIHLRHFAGLSFARIAEVLGEPLGTVLARQHRALGKLRQMLGGGEE